MPTSDHDGSSTGVSARIRSLSAPNGKTCRSTLVEPRLHAHSPASFDYGGLEGSANGDPKPSFQEWIRAYIAAGVDGIVVTDHNSHAGIESARQALEEMRGEDPELPQFVIFPGVEITATGGTHVLGVFDLACDADIVKPGANSLPLRRHSRRERVVTAPPRFAAAS